MGRDHRFSILACHGDSVSHFVASVLSVFVPPRSRVGLLASFSVPKFPKTIPRCPLSMSLTPPVVLRRGVWRSIGGPCPDALSFFPRIRRSDRSSRMYGNPIECFGPASCVFHGNTFVYASPQEAAARVRKSPD